MALTITLLGRPCRKCGFGKETGWHMTVEACDASLARAGRTCSWPEEHHRFQRHWLTVKRT